jgi:AcrR family transcriptional regulator
MERTRSRITQAALELHGTIGPAATTMSAVADKAGVTRATLYRHFPTEAALFTACTTEWRVANPPPEPTAWVAIGEPRTRTMTALESLYGWYRSTEQMRSNLLRDVDSLPEGMRARISSSPRAVVDILDSAWPGPSRLRRAAIGHAVGFETWRSLAREGLTDDQAARLMTKLVEQAADA